jgi:hypothetical protein
MIAGGARRSNDWNHYYNQAYNDCMGR